MAKMFIGGESVDSVTKNSSEVRNPASGATVDTVPQGNDKDVQQAIQAAEEAFKAWSDVSPEDRGVALMNAGELIKKNTGDLRNPRMACLVSPRRLSSQARLCARRISSRVRSELPNCLRAAR